MKFGLVNPLGMSLQDWSAAFVYSMADTLALPQLEREAEFPEWAGQIVQEPSLEPYRLPMAPDSVQDWQSWAFQVMDALAASGGF